MHANGFYKHFFFSLFCLLANYLMHAQSSLLQLHEALTQATTSVKKVDAYFALSTRYSDRLKVDSGIFYANKIKEVSMPITYEGGIGKYHLALGMALLYRGRNEESEQNVLKAIEIFTRHTDVGILGRAHWQLATCQFAQKKVEVSRKNYWIAIRYLAVAKDFNGSFRANFLLARTYEKTAEIDSAAYYYVRALALAEQLNDHKRVSEAASEVGKCYLSQGDLQNAYKFLRYGLHKRSPANDKIATRIILEHYATVLMLLNDFNRADSVIKEFELMNASINDAWGEMALNRMRGRLAFGQKHYSKSLHYLQQANNKIGEVRAAGSELKDLALLLGMAEFENTNYSSAILHLQTAARLAHELRHVFDEMEVNRLLSKAFEKLGRPDSALQYYRNYSLLKDSFLLAQKQKNVIEIVTRYETAKKEQEIKILQKESEANNYLLQLNTQQLQQQQLESQQKTNQFILVSKQNEINKLDASKKTLSLDNEKKENEKSQTKLKLLETEAAYQKLLTSKESQQKKLAYAGIAAILVLGGFGVHRYTHRKKMQTQRDVLNERLRISRELHDELGSTLSGIAMYSHITRNQIKDGKNEEIERSLTSMQHSAGEMVNKLNDIVWLVNPEKDSLEKLMERLEEYVDNMAAIKNIAVKIDVGEKLSEVELPVQTRRNIYLFCKEAINNAVKYSNASLIELTMKEVQNKIVFSVCDNGKGFDVAHVKKGNGLLSMKERAEKINGTFSLKSTPGKGTDVSLICKIT